MFETTPGLSDSKTQTLLLLGLLGGAGYLAWRWTSGGHEAEWYNIKASLTGGDSKKALIAKGRANPLSLTQDEAKMWGTIDPEGLGAATAQYPQQMLAIVNGVPYNPAAEPTLEEMQAKLDAGQINDAEYQAWINAHLQT